MSKEMSREQIEAIKKERNARKRMMKDRAVYVISLMALPSILLMVASLIFSAQTLQDSQLAVISGLVSSVTVGLITLLQRATGTEQEKEDPMVVLAKTLVEHMTQGQGQTEIIMDKNRVIVIGKDQQIITRPDTELIQKVVEKK